MQSSIAKSVANSNTDETLTKGVECMMIISCALTVMVNMTSIPWNNFDMTTKTRSIKYCGKYDMCLKKFEKKEGPHYNVTCGMPIQTQEIDTTINI